MYASSSASPNYGLNQLGTGLPTAAGAAVTLLPGFPTASGPSSYAFYFADLSPTVPGPDVVYVADDNPTGGIQKWSLAGGTWALNGTIGNSTTALLRGLAGTTAGTAVRLVASGGGGLYTVADNAGYNAAPTTTTLPAPLVMPPANTAFRGVALAPVATALATAKAAESFAVAVYPVPASQQVRVQVPALGSATLAHAALFNSLGQQVLSQQTPLPAGGTTLTLNIVGLPTGVYSLRLRASEYLATKQLVIANP